MDLTTTYLGLPLKNPLVASASPLLFELDNIRRIEDASGAAVVLPSLFEEQIEQESGRFEQYTTAGPGSFAEAFSYLPSAASYRTSPHEVLGNYPQGTRGCLHPGDRKFEWCHRGRLDRSCASGAGRRRKRDRASTCSSSRLIHR